MTVSFSEKPHSGKILSSCDIRNTSVSSLRIGVGISSCMSIAHTCRSVNRTRVADFVLEVLPEPDRVTGLMFNIRIKCETDPKLQAE